ncbi:MAG: hypothetical protein COB84_01880 [Rhodobacteraceae bacterium]|nr:MAG: hypothetical protein COB84_01880 [Paracoccaceae bacterium]
MTDVINEIIDQAISALVNDSPEKSAESLEELAHVFARGGQPLQSFLNMRTYIITQASEQTSALFIQEKVKVQEQILREKRNASRKIIIH